MYMVLLYIIFVLGIELYIHLVQLSFVWHLFVSKFLVILRYRVWNETVSFVQCVIKVDICCSCVGCNLLS